MSASGLWGGSLAASTLLALAGAAGVGGQDAERRAEPDPALARATRALDAAADSWSEEQRCVSCHSNGLALVAQPSVHGEGEALRRTRGFAAEYLSRYAVEGQAPRGQRGSTTGVVATTAFLAMSDARSADEVHAVTRAGLDRAWEALDPSGTWEGWLQCNWPPFEVDTAFAPALLLVALGELRGRFGEEALRPADREGAAALQAWLREHGPAGLHDRAMRLWAGVHWPEVAGPKDLAAWRAELEGAQREDGGWSMGALSTPEWKRDGGQPQASTSGAYATAFALHTLLRVGEDPRSDRVRRGRAWLLRHQSEDGGWRDRSPRRDGRHYIGRAATAFAVMVLAETADASRPR